MVHRTHLDICHNYYPPEFETWWTDDWITNLHKPNRSTKLKAWSVHHNNVHGTRYEVNFTKYKRLLKIKSVDKRILDKYILSKKFNNRIKRFFFLQKLRYNYYIHHLVNK